MTLDIFMCLFVSGFVLHGPSGTHQQREKLGSI